MARLSRSPSINTEHSRQIRPLAGEQEHGKWSSEMSFHSDGIFRTKVPKTLLSSLRPRCMESQIASMFSRTLPLATSQSHLLGISRPCQTLAIKPSHKNLLHPPPEPLYRLITSKHFSGSEHSLHINTSLRTKHTYILIKPGMR